MRGFSQMLIGLIGALALVACSGGGKNAAITQDDISIGQASAPVKIVEYASVACPGCASFNNQVWGDLKKQFIDTGVVQWTTKEMFTHDPAWSAAGFMMARCLGKDKYYDVLDALYLAQPEIDASGDRKAGLLKVGKQFGMSEKQFEQCVSNEEELAKMNDRVERTMRDDRVPGTPTFMINGEEFTQTPTLANLSAAINAAKARAGK